MLVDRTKVVHWEVKGKYRVGYSAFGTMCWAEEIVEKEVVEQVEAPHIVISQDAKTAYYFYKLPARQTVKIVLKRDQWMDEIQLSCGCVHKARFMNERQRVELAQGQQLACVVHYNA